MEHTIECLFGICSTAVCSCQRNWNAVSCFMNTAEHDGLSEMPGPAPLSTSSQLKTYLSVSVMSVMFFQHALCPGRHYYICFHCVVAFMKSEVQYLFEIEYYS